MRGIVQDVLREVEQPLDVDLLQPGLFQLHAHERDVLAQFVALTFVRRTVDALGVQELGFDVVLTTIQFLQPGFELRPHVDRARQSPVPHVEDDQLEQRHELRLRPKTFQQGEELSLQSLGPDADAAALPAVVVAVLAGTALRGASGQGQIAAVADYEPPEGELRIVEATALCRGTTCGQPLLNPREQCVRHDGREVAPNAFQAESRRVHLACVDRLAKHRTEGLGSQRLPVEGPEPQGRYRDERVRQMLARTNQLERTADQRRAVRVGHEARLTGPSISSPISQRGAPRPVAAFESSHHACRCPFRLHVVVELSDGGEYVLSQLTHRVVANRLVD